VLYRRTGAADIEVTDDPAAAPIAVSLDFAHVSSLRWCDERRELLASATPVGLSSPSVPRDDRGDRRLFACRPGDEWRPVGDRGFADDPVATRDAYVVSRGAGIKVFDGDGRVVHEFKRGRFNWGPPSLSLSRDGSYVAWVRWRGDDRKLCVMDLTDYGVTEFAHSLYRYAWLDDRTVLYLLGGPPQALDVVTGESRRFNPNRFTDISVAGDGVWFVDEVGGGVARCAHDGSALRQVWLEERSLGSLLKREKRRAESIVAVEAGSVWLLLAVYRG
jgi:hypothetical protein